MLGHVDCNAFFCSCESLFRPETKNKPVIVLSNNDGMIVALNKEAKKLGLKRGMVYFKIKKFLEYNKVFIFSSNQSLYGDISDRYMNTLAGQVPRFYPYSIDEAFFEFSGVEQPLTAGHEIIDRMYQYTGIPSCMGLADTFTLCKIATRFAKKYKGYENVCIIDSEEKRIIALQKTDVSDIWGIGDEYTAELKKHSVKTAYDFTLKSPSWIKKKFTIKGLKTWLELKGHRAITPEEVEEVQNKEQICTSKSYSTPIKDFDTLMSYTADHAAAS